MTGRGLLDLLPETSAEIIFLDLSLPDMDGLEVLTKMKESGTYAGKVIILSMFEESKVVKAAFKAGTDGYVLKSSQTEEIFKAIEAVLDGETYIGNSLSLTNKDGGSPFIMLEGKVSFSYDDRFVKKHGLSKREFEVLKLVAQAMTNKEIADELYISDQTVSVHRKNLMRKLGVGNTASLIKMVFENNLL